MQLSASARLATLLPRRLPARASKCPWQPLATRKALRPMRPRSDPRSSPKRWRKPSRRTSSFWRHPDGAKALPTWQGKTIIDVTNAYGVPPEELGGQPSSKFVAQTFTGARLVKGFNHLVAAVLDQDPAVHGGRRVVFLASDDDGAAAEIGALAENLGFSPIKLGGLSEGGLLVQARGNSWGRLIFKDLVKFD